MICHSCGTKNKDDATFCTECGIKLVTTQAEKMSCPECGFKNAINTNYCSNCGKSLSQPKTKKRIRSDSHNSQKSAAKKQSDNSTAKLIAVLAVVAVVSIYVVKTIAPQQTAQRSAPLTPATSEPIMNPNTFAVAKQFRCSCGTCGGTPLEECSCPTAKKEHSFIAEQLRMGKSIEQTVALVDSAFGWKKQELNTPEGNG